MCSEITTIIFSKNRACQLELLLRSLNMPATVLYTHDPEFKLGYEKLIGMYPSVKFVCETNFKEQLTELVGTGGEYTMFLVDDDVMIEPFSEDCPEFVEFKRNPEILCLSLRASPGYIKAPIIKNNTWKWEGSRFSWGYPISATSHVYRKEDIFPAISQKDTIIEIPNDIEVVVKAPNRPLMMCFDKPRFINNTANQVQIKYKFRNLNVPLKDLENKFLGGERLSLEHIKRAAGNSRRVLMGVQYEWEKIIV